MNIDVNTSLQHLVMLPSEETLHSVWRVQRENSMTFNYSQLLDDYIYQLTIWQCKSCEQWYPINPFNLSSWKCKMTKIWEDKRF